MENSISAIFNSMPDFLTTHDLVKLGFFDNPNAAYLARLRGQSPDYIKIGRKIFYLKSNVISFLSSRLKSGNLPKKAA